MQITVTSARLPKIMIAIGLGLHVRRVSSSAIMQGLSGRL